MKIDLVLNNLQSHKTQGNQGWVLWLCRLFNTKSIFIFHITLFGYRLFNANDVTFMFIRCPLDNQITRSFDVL